MDFYIQMTNITFPFNKRSGKKNTPKHTTNSSAILNLSGMDAKTDLHYLSWLICFSPLFFKEIFHFGDSLSISQPNKKEASA